MPIALSLLMLTGMLVSFTMFGPPVREADEGIGAHIFQIWLVLEFLTIGYFGLKWLPQRHKEAFIILAIQILLVFINCFPVFYFNL